jgi:hypothetical protein
MEKEDIVCAVAAFGAGGVVKCMYVELLWIGTKGLIAQDLRFEPPVSLS